MITNILGVVSSPLSAPKYDNIVLDLATEDGCDIVGLDILGASAFIPLGKRGYDAKTDVLLLGRATSNPEMTIENNDFIGYWEIDKFSSDDFWVPIGVAIKRASVHLAKVMTENNAPTPAP